VGRRRAGKARVRGDGGATATAPARKSAAHAA